MTLNEKFDIYMEINEILARNAGLRGHLIDLYNAKLNMEKKRWELAEERDTAISKIDDLDESIDSLSRSISFVLQSLSQK